MLEQLKCGYLEGEGANNTSSEKKEKNNARIGQFFSVRVTHGTP
jgi:hypothetical protein